MKRTKNWLSCAMNKSLFLVSSYTRSVFSSENRGSVYLTQILGPEVLRVLLRFGLANSRAWT